MAKATYRRKRLFDSWFQRDKSPSWWRGKTAEMARHEAECLYLQAHTGSRERNWKWNKAVNSQSPPAVTCFLQQGQTPKGSMILPELHCNWVSSIKILGAYERHSPFKPRRGYLNTIRRWLVTPTTLVPLLHQRAYLAKPFCYCSSSMPRWVRWWLLFSSGSIFQHMKANQLMNLLGQCQLDFFMFILQFT